MGHTRTVMTQLCWAQARMVYRAGLVVVILAAMVFGWRRQVAIKDLRESLAHIHYEELSLRSEVQRTEEELARLRVEDATERTQFQNLAARVANLAGQKVDLDLNETHDRWNLPPEGVSSWDPASPYVWVEKDLLPQLPLQSFDSHGNLDAATASALVIEPEQLNEMHRQLHGLMDEFQQIEAAHATRVEEEGSEFISEQPHTLTVRVEFPLDAFEDLRRRFQETLAGFLGTQRAELLVRLAQNGQAFPLGQPAPSPRTFTVTREEDGQFRLIVRSEFVNMSVSGSDAVDQYVPEHLREVFAPFIEVPVKVGEGP